MFHLITVACSLGSCVVHFLCDAAGADVAVRYTVTRRGAPSLLLDGFGYVARKRRGTRVYWSCRSRAQGCPARALTSAGRLQARVLAHNHAPHAPALHEHTRIESLIETISTSRHASWAPDDARDHYFHVIARFELMRRRNKILLSIAFNVFLFFLQLIICLSSLVCLIELIICLFGNAYVLIDSDGMVFYSGVRDI